MTDTAPESPTWHDQLRDAGLRATRPRVLVLEALSHAEGHYSADAVVGVLRDAGTPIARASVYNVLDDLAAAGLAMRADYGPGQALYEVAHSWHHHFVCRSCGTIIDVACAAGEKPCLHPDLPGIEVDEAQIIFRGLCAECSARG